MCNKPRSPGPYNHGGMTRAMVKNSLLRGKPLPHGVALSHMPRAGYESVNEPLISYSHKHKHTVKTQYTQQRDIDANGNVVSFLPRDNSSRAEKGFAR